MKEKAHILIVDSQKDMRDALADVFREEGYRVTDADNAYEAAERIRAIPFDVVITDIDVPGISGLELIQKLQQENPKLAIIVMTGQVSLDAEADILGSGVYSFIAKPFPAEQLLLIVKKAVREKEILRENETLLEKLEKITKELERSKEQLYHSEKSANIGRLTAGVSHELKNLLGIISIVAHSLKNKIDENDEKAVKYLQSIEKQVNHSNKLILSLLSLSRPGENGPLPTDMNELVKETVSLIEHQFLLQNIKTISEYDASLPQIPTEINQMKQVFTNILLNAQEAMPKGGELHISTQLKKVSSQTNGSSIIEIIFQDTGCGIPEENLDKIFNSFFSTSQKEGKSGLGLPISRDIIRHHDGDIEVKSQLGAGTSIIIKLPVKKQIIRGEINKKDIIIQENSIDKKALSLIKNTPGGVSLEEIEKVLELEAEPVRHTIEKMIMEGVAVKEGENYRATPDA